LIIEIPEAQDYATASLNLLNMAWDLAFGSMRAWQESTVIHPLPDTPKYKLIDDQDIEQTTGGPDESYTLEERKKAESDFWLRSQPALGNALAMVQQAVELALIPSPFD
jgi:hypothetical protein